MLDPRNIKLAAFHRRNQKYSLVRKIARLFTEGYLLDVRVIRDFMRENIGDITFQVVKYIFQTKLFAGSI